MELVISKHLTRIMYAVILEEKLDRHLTTVHSCEMRTYVIEVVTLKNTSCRGTRNKRTDFPYELAKLSSGQYTCAFVRVI